MQYTIRRIPTHLDRALRRWAKEQGRSLNDVALEALERGLGLSTPAESRRKLDDLAGTWQEDPEFDAALESQRRIDVDLWK